MKRTAEMGWMVAVAVLCLLTGMNASPAAAQVVREEGVGSVAGVLTDSYAEFTFQSRGGEILFADLDSDVYQTQGRVEEDHEEGHSESAVAAEHEDGDGCAGEGGPGRLCLQVVDEQDQVTCYAVRPSRPGWQRDPRLMCALPETDGAPQTYRLRVAVPLHGEGCGQAVLYGTPAENVPFLLNVSLRPIAPEGTLSRALGISTSRF